MNKQSVFVTTLILILSGCGGSSESSEDSSSSSSTPSPSTGNNIIDDPVIEPDPVVPTDAYLQFQDSPYANIDFSGGYFYLEDFEDGVLEHPGASANRGDFTTISFGPNFHDSVDADDGLIDGNSLDGESWFYKRASTGVTWSFDAQQLDDQLPTHVGIVWTDGKGPITFEAFDENGDSLSVQTGNHADTSFNGETAEDRFYGVIHAGGISSFQLYSDSINGIEMDHLQWGFVPSQ